MKGQGETGSTGPAGPDLKGKYVVRVTGSTGPAGSRETAEASNTEVEGLLKGLLLAFENAGTDNYHIQRAKTSITTTRNTEGKLELSLGMSIFKLFDAGGNVKQETREGIEIEIERIKDKD